MRKRITWLFWMAVVTAGCLDPYFAATTPADANILVIDGFLDTSNGTATLDLSRGVSLSLPDSFPSVSGAFVSVEDALGNVHPMTEGAAGNYRATGIPIYKDAQYRLHIVTPENDEYYSTVVTPQTTPPIDSVTWVTDEDKLTIRVNAHDNTNQAKYYRWSFEETWNYHAATVSQYKVVGNSIVARQPNEITFYCWRTQPSTNIIIGSTARLSQNIISQVSIQHVPAGSQKFQIKYSILVKQRSVSEDEYNYLEQLKKTTESIGGLFDPQPGQVTGNVHRTRSDSPIAVGYFGAGNTVQDRIFISTAILPRQFREIYPRPGCYPPDTVCVTLGAYQCILTAQDLTESHILGHSIDDDAAFTLTTSPCSDCRYDGGVLTKPDFWP
jgi:hypothetical protein